MNKSLLIFVIVAAVVVLALAGFWYYSEKTTGPAEQIDINKIMENLDEYTSPTYLNTLTTDQKKQLYISVNESFYKNCASGRIGDSCSTYLLLSILRLRANIDYSSLFPSDTNSMPLGSKIYQNFRADHQILTEDDLSGFEVPFLISICPLLNSSERIFWFDNIFDIPKTKSQTTDFQVTYSTVCLYANSLDTLSNITGKSREELKDNICNIMTRSESVNLTDLCSIYDYIYEKRFCEANLTADDKTMMEDAISQNYTSYYQSFCKDSLTGLYNYIYNT